MEKSSSDVKKTPHDDLKPVVAPIPDGKYEPKIPPPMPDGLEKLLTNSAMNRATQLLIERDNGRVRVRQRIRGVLITEMRVTLTGMDVQEIFRFVQKSGDVKHEEGLSWATVSMELLINDEPYSCRFLVSETKNFGSLTVHFAKKEDKAFNPAAWGMGPNQTTLLENFMAKSHGLILFSGTDQDDVFPYIQAATKSLATPERHVISLSAQPQPWFAGVEQMVSNGDPEFFSRLLKVAARHEPDLMVVYPVEKKTHLELCLTEAMRGRLVFARMYASDAADTLTQVLGMNVEPYLVGSGLIGIVSQRTLRLNCQACQEKETVSRDRLKEIGLPVGMQPAAFYHGKGCDACFRSGFDRETSIFEVLEMTDELRGRLSRDMKTESLRALMKNNGLMTLRQVALHKAINGQTPLSEVLRVSS